MQRKGCKDYMGCTDCKAMDCLPSQHKDLPHKGYMDCMGYMDCTGCTGCTGYMDCMGYMGYMGYMGLQQKPLS